MKNIYLEARDMHVFQLLYDKDRIFVNSDHTVILC